VRLFIALNLPTEERRTIHAATSALRSLDGVRWVSAETLHLTLVFLGELEADATPAVRSALRATARTHPSVSLTLGGVGVFPDARRPRVVWLGAKGGDGLTALQSDIADAMRDCDIHVDPRPFRAHITLGRARRSSHTAGHQAANQRSRAIGAARLRELGETVRYQRRVVISTVDLVRSELTRGGARHRTVFQAALKGPGS
jgi:RNA 2',3'-cyclic 3'-phosphodiesterase